MEDREGELCGYEVSILRPMYGRDGVVDHDGIIRSKLSAVRFDCEIV